MGLSLIVYSFSACGTCKKGLNWLNKNNIQYELIDIVANPPDRETIAKAIESVGDKKFLFNSRGQSYSKLGAEVVKAMSKEEAIQELASDGKLIKRPFLKTSSGQFLLGFNEREWSETLLN